MQAALPRRRGVLGGLVIVAVGIPFVLQPLGVVAATTYLFVTLGIAFAVAYARAPTMHVYLTPACVFLGFGVGLLIPIWLSLAPQYAAPVFLTALAVGFVAVYLLHSERRWSLVPAALLAAVTLLALFGPIDSIPALAQTLFVPAVLIAVGVYTLLETSP